MPEDPSKKKKRGRPPEKIIILDYGMISALASQDWTHKAIAEKCGMTEKAFSRRLNWDTQLQEALSKSNESLDYNYIYVLASDNCSDAEIARKIRMSKSQFSDRKKKDSQLVDALDAGRNDYVIVLKHEKKQSIRPQYKAICRECGYVMYGLERYKDRDDEGKEVIRERAPIDCKKCGSSKLEYKERAPSIAAQIWESKQHLNEKDKVEHSGDDKKPIVFERKLSEVELDAQIERFIASRERKLKEQPDQGAPKVL